MRDVGGGYALFEDLVAYEACCAGYDDFHFVFGDGGGGRVWDENGFGEVEAKSGGVGELDVAIAIAVTTWNCRVVNM